MRSWHVLWKSVDEYLQSAENGAEAEVTRPNSSLVIASFSTVDLQEQSIENQVRKWESIHFGSYHDREFFVNRNIHDFHWLLLDGAIHEVPYELSYFERKAARNPDGLVAYGIGLMEEWRDMHSNRAASG